MWIFGSFIRNACNCRFCDVNVLLGIIAEFGVVIGKVAEDGCVGGVYWTRQF